MFNALHRSRGFTIIEIIVAVAIFSLIGLASTGVMVSVIDSNALSEQRFSRLQNLQRAMMIMERDFLQMTPRAIRIDGQTNNRVISGDKNAFESEADGVGFVRSGWQNPQLMLHRSTLQAVAYRLQEGRLERLYFNYVDNVIGTEPKVRVLMEDVEDLQFTFLLDPDEDPEDPENWEEKLDSEVLPAAITIELTTQEFGLINRQFLTGSGG